MTQAIHVSDDQCNLAFLLSPSKEWEDEKVNEPGRARDRSSIIQVHLATLQRRKVSKESSEKKSEALREGNESTRWIVTETRAERLH